MYVWQLEHVELLLTRSRSVMTPAQAARIAAMARTAETQPAASSSSQSFQPKPALSATSTPQNVPLGTGTITNAQDASAGSQPKPVTGSTTVTNSHQRTESDQMKRLSGSKSISSTTGAEPTPKPMVIRTKTCSGAPNSVTDTEVYGKMIPIEPTSAESTAKGEISVDEHPTASDQVPGSAEDLAGPPVAKADKQPEVHPGEVKDLTGSDADESSRAI